MKSYNRVKYNNCPLIEVAYQINFPSILSIDAEEPVAFQERIRDKFPIYVKQVRKENQVAINVDNNNPMPFFQKQQERNEHLFISKDEKWRITLANNMIALSSMDYKYWEDMSSRFVDSFKALEDIYKPAFYERVGLRYIDAFVKQKLGVEDKKWSDLLEPHVCGCLSYSSDVEMVVRNSMVHAEVYDGDVSIRLSSGLGKLDQHDGNAPQDAFILNCDYFVLGKFSTEEIKDKTEKVHHRSHIFFRDAITDTLHAAMQPRELDK